MSLTALSEQATAEPEVVQRMYARHGAACLAHARDVLRDPDLAQDAVQEAFLELWRHPLRFDSTQSSVRSWLLMLTHRKAVDRVRCEQRRATMPLTAVAEPVADSRGPAATATATVLGEQVRFALAALPLTQRRTLVLAYWGGYSQSEIAALTGLPLGTVKSRTHAAMTRLADALGAWDGGGSAAAS